MTVRTQAALWFVLIVIGGGIIGVALGHGFYGEKRSAAAAGVVDGDTVVPPLPPEHPQSGCATCHPEK
jgi:hypothetical protein